MSWKVAAVLMGACLRWCPRMQIVAASSVEAGREVHNTYGELGSAELVSPKP